MVTFSGLLILTLVPEDVAVVVVRRRIAWLRRHGSTQNIRRFLQLLRLPLDDAKQAKRFEVVGTWPANQPAELPRLGPITCRVRGLRLLYRHGHQRC